MTMRTKEELQGVTELGSGHTVYQNTYAPEVLECFPNKHEEAPYMVKLNCPEFTSLCPNRPAGFRPDRDQLHPGP